MHWDAPFYTFSHDLGQLAVCVRAPSGISFSLGLGGPISGAGPRLQDTTQEHPRWRLIHFKPATEGNEGFLGNRKACHPGEVGSSALLESQCKACSAHNKKVAIRNRPTIWKDDLMTGLATFYTGPGVVIWGSCPRAYGIAVHGADGPVVFRRNSSTIRSGLDLTDCLSAHLMRARERTLNG